MANNRDDTPRPPLRVIETGRAERLVNVRYEDLLRVIGYFIDEHKWKDIVLTQLPDGVLLKGLIIESTPQGMVERIEGKLFTNDVVVEMLDAGFRRRQQPLPPPDVASPSSRNPFRRR
jgi:hypothetical protein